MAWGIVAFSVEYARWALALRSGRPPGGLAAAWLLEWLWIPLMVLAAVGLVVRFRRSRGEERQQLKWLALSMIVLALMITCYGVVVVALRASPGPENLDEYLAVLSFLAIPVSIAIGVLKYRLYDIDIVINKAVVYGGLAAFITIVYVAVVVGIGAAVGATSSAALGGDVHVRSTPGAGTSVSGELPIVEASVEAIREG